MTKKVGRALFGVALLAILAQSATIAQVTQEYCIDGNSDAVGWSWRITAADDDALIAEDLMTGPAPVSGDTIGIRDAWIASINGAGVGGLTAVLSFTDPICPGWDTAMAITYAEPFELSVGPAAGPPDGCNLNFAVCAFNPIAKLSTLQSSQIPTLSEWGLGAMMLVLGVASVMAIRRRFAGES